MCNIRIIDSIKIGPSIKNEFEKGLSIYQLFSEIQTLNNTLQTFMFSDLAKLFYPIPFIPLAVTQQDFKQIKSVSCTIPVSKHVIYVF